MVRVRLAWLKSSTHTGTYAHTYKWVGRETGTFPEKDESRRPRTSPETNYPPPVTDSITVCIAPCFEVQERTLSIATADQNFFFIRCVNGRDASLRNDTDTQTQTLFLVVVVVAILLAPL